MRVALTLTTCLLASAAFSTPSLARHSHKTPNVDAHARAHSAHARYRDKVDFVVVAVAVNESRSSVQRHLAQHPLPFQFLWDTNGNAVRAFQAPATSYIVVLDGSGKIAYTGVGEDQDIEAAIRRVVK